MKAHILTSGNSKETAIFDLQTTHIQTYKISKDLHEAL